MLGASSLDPSSSTSPWHSAPTAVGHPSSNAQPSKSVPSPAKTETDTATSTSHDVKDEYSQTKGAMQCTTSRGTGPQAGSVFLCCCTPSSVLLFQWYEPLNKFLLVRSSELDSSLRFPLSPFELINARTDFPQLCVGVQATRIVHLDRFAFDSCFEILNPTETLDVSMFNNAKLDVVGMSQIGKDSLLFAYKNKLVPPSAAFQSGCRDLRDTLSKSQSMRLMDNTGDWRKDVNATDKDGYTPLHYAVQTGQNTGITKPAGITQRYICVAAHDGNTASLAYGLLIFEARHFLCRTSLLTVVLLKLGFCSIC
ncbi:unnamed protein product [Cylicocyclus nassatus]|uniref:CNH domain-containing protein n=1 Tax=Cylicocyclus nassatus TaxID=53992 RepID=A0AA36M4X1_CYLNA|nr:unnamed protein product [Cylicocyclus nassatus]